MSDDPAVNIKFVELVEKYSYIYDYRRQDHSKRVIVEKAWNAIANEIKLSGPQCKEKWKNLRTAFTRSMKKPPSGSGAKKIKDYYLKDVMQFITPFIKSKPQEGNLPTETEPTLNEDEIESEANTNDDDYSKQEITASEKPTENQNIVKNVQEKNLSTQAKCLTTASIVPPEKRRKVSTTILNEADKCFIEFVKAKTSTTYSAKEKLNTDLQFLTSLLPDLVKLTDYQKRQFKKRTLDLLDELLCDGPPQNITMMVSIPSPSPVYSSYSGQTSVSTHSSHSFPTRNYEEEPTPVQSYIQTFSPDIDGTDRDFSIQKL